MSIINEIIIRWHRWRMEKTYATSRNLCRHHAEQLAMRVKNRNSNG